MICSLRVAHHPPPKNQGGADRFTEDLSEFRQIYLRIQVFVGLVMLESNTLVSYSPKLSYAELTLKYVFTSRIWIVSTRSSPAMISERITT